MTKVAVVTGANKGIGYSIVKGLCKQFDGVVYLTGSFFFKFNKKYKKDKSIMQTYYFNSLCC